MRYIDSHSHLNFPAYDKDRNEVIKRMEEQEVASIDVGTTLETSRAAIDLAEKNNNIWAAIGIHPSHANENQFFDKDELREKLDGPILFDKQGFSELIKSSKVVAIGECGLDYFHKPYDAERQKELFRAQLDFAVENKKPVILHCRDAHSNALEILKDYNDLTGTTHFFTGTIEEAQKYIDLGFYIGLDGPITFADSYDKLIEELLLDKILIETDCPYASPAPYRGQRNEPIYVIEIAKKIAKLKGISLEQVAAQTTKSAKELFNI